MELLKDTEAAQLMNTDSKSYQSEKGDEAKADETEPCKDPDQGADGASGHFMDDHDSAVSHHDKVGIDGASSVVFI